MEIEKPPIMWRLLNVLETALCFGRLDSFKGREYATEVASLFRIPQSPEKVANFFKKWQIRSKTSSPFPP
jgi:hypothetical protein